MSEVRVRVLPFGVHGSDLKSGNWKKNRSNTGHYGWRSVPSIAKWLNVSTVVIYAAIRAKRVECKIVGGMKYVPSTTLKSDVLKRDCKPRTQE